jgi:hypothetical protein
MNTKEARELSEKNRKNLDWENNGLLMAVIKAACEKGETSVTYYKELRQAVVEAYQSEGYVIKIEQCGDRNSGESCYKISW